MSPSRVLLGTDGDGVTKTEVVSSEYTLARVFTYMDAPSCLYRRTEVGTATRVAAGRLCTYIQCTQAGGGGVPLDLLLCTELLLDAA